MKFKKHYIVQEDGSKVTYHEYLKQWEKGLLTDAKRIDHLIMEAEDGKKIKVFLDDEQNLRWIHYKEA